MDITFNCDQCGQSITIDGAGAGLQVKCPKCGKNLSVPATATPNVDPGSTTTPSAAQTGSPASRPMPVTLPATSTVQPPPILKQTFIELLRADYLSALSVIDNEVKALIENGQEAKALMLLMDYFKKITEIRDTLNTFYGIFFNNVDVLKRFGSERLKQLGYELQDTTETLKEKSDWTETEQMIAVLDNLSRVGVKKEHWFLGPIIPTEIEYMLDTLQILIEPDFVPFSETQRRTGEAEDKPDRYVPPEVKLAVWRRDQGKCVQCKSKEKLEYDHIIPVSKGGSNTERNVQLLCEKCNREKAAKIA